MEKPCLKCGETKRLSDFYADPKAADGHASACKQCARAGALANYRRDRLNGCDHGRGERSHDAEAADNAKWDRIFQKFVDPGYYTGRFPTVQSSFGAFASSMEVLCRA